MHFAEMAVLLWKVKGSCFGRFFAVVHTANDLVGITMGFRAIPLRRRSCGCCDTLEDKLDLTPFTAAVFFSFLKFDNQIIFFIKNNVR